MNAKTSLMLVGIVAAWSCGDSPDDAAEPASIPLPLANWTTAADLPELRNLDETSSCSACLDIAPVTVLGSELEGARSIDGGTSGVAIDREGRYWVGQLESLLVLSPSGEVVSRVGRRGQGPLEFQNPIVDFSTSDGGVVVHDSRNARISVINEAFELVRTHPIQGVIRDIVPLSDSVYFANAASSRGQPFQILVNGVVSREFGSPPDSPGAEMLSVGPVAAHPPDGTLYSSSQYEYDLVVRDTAGAILTRVAKADFNVPPVELGAFTEENPPPNTVLDLKVDDDGFVWVLKWVREDGWRDGVISSGTDGQLRFLDNDPGNVFDTEVDVVDPSRGTVVARARTEVLIRGFAGDDQAYANESDDIGVPSIRIVRLELTGVGR